MCLENVIGNLLTCTVPLAGGSQVGLRQLDGHRPSWYSHRRQKGCGGEPVVHSV